MLPIGRTRYIDFRLATVDGAPITDRVLEDWQSAPNRLVFLRDTLTCSDALTLKNYGDGRYTLSYQPSSPGHDYLELYDQEADIQHLDIEDIVPSDFATGGGSVFSLNEDFGGDGALLVMLPEPESYTLQVYLSNDWDNNRRDDGYAAGASAVLPDGSWQTAISVPSGTYHVVASKFRQQNVIKPYLGVG